LGWWWWLRFLALLPLTLTSRASEEMMPRVDFNHHPFDDI
jgi:hypothetical protein